MSFAVIISEKGGQERREVFDKNEISIGRVQGNDLLLPKGNVSKRHARIVFRDGRFIVTDLKSTNGSYVNGHRIAQATIVREGDKIYIGDFILKVEAMSGPSAAPQTPDRRPIDSDVPGALNEPSVATPPPRASNEGSAVSHIPLEQDPDELSATGMPIVQGVGRTTIGESRPPRPMPMQSAGAVARVQTGNQSSQQPSQPSQAPAPARPAMAPAVGAGPAIASRPRSKDPVASRPGHGNALSALLNRLTDVVDLDEGDAFAPLSDGKRTSVERVLREQARALQQEGELPAGVVLDDLIRDATREALGSGPLEALLDDEDVVEVQVARFDQIMIHREGGQSSPAEFGFSSEQGLRRAVGRLAHSAGIRGRDDSTIDARLPNGANLTAILPPVAANGTVVVIRKRRRADLGLEDLIRSGTLSRGMATFLQQCLAAKANVLIAGPLGAGTTTLMGALASSTSLEERVFAIQEIDELVLPHPYGASFMVPDTGDAGARVVRMATSLRPDRLLVGVMAGDIIGQVMEAIGGGVDGVIAAVRGPTLRQALARLAPALIAARPGLDAASARSWIASSFDIAVEVARLKGGRHRVLRVSELTADATEIKTRDVFEFALDPQNAERGEGSFQPLGVIPAVVQELKSHGHKVDEAIFRRQPR
jgi:pilus assembly protein CpaF